MLALVGAGPRSYGLSAAWAPVPKATLPTAMETARPTAATSRAARGRRVGEGVTGREGIIRGCTLLCSLR
ncbi:hypothetical protein GCM10023193_27730 [Planotetraspora kaengkrachanensis]